MRIRHGRKRESGLAPRLLTIEQREGEAGAVSKCRSPIPLPFLQCFREVAGEFPGILRLFRLNMA